MVGNIPGALSAREYGVILSSQSFGMFATTVYDGGCLPWSQIRSPGRPSQLGVAVARKAITVQRGRLHKRKGVRIVCTLQYATRMYIGIKTSDGWNAHRPRVVGDNDRTSRRQLRSVFRSGLLFHNVTKRCRLLFRSRRLFHDTTKRYRLLLRSLALDGKCTRRKGREREGGG